MSQDKVIDDCWNTIGCWGEQLPRCEKLEVFGHCFNCDVYSGAGRKLLNRPSPEGYLEEWRELLNAVAPERDIKITSLLIFSVWGNYFALPTKMLVKITDSQPVHRIPHVNDESVLGITNIVGELLVSISFIRAIGAREYLRIDADSPYKRSIVVKAASSKWAIPVNEVMGIHKLDIQECRTQQQSLHSDCVDVFFSWQDKTIAYIDENSLLAALEGVRL